MAKSKPAEAVEATDPNKKRARTIYYGEADWELLTAQANREGRTISMHLAFVIQEREAAQG